jgi:peptidoglycan/LPS O-acetylase OafA/YrhL
LRAVAVLAVVADHLGNWPSGGFVGVDVFFVISGYLITGLLVREFAATGTISFRRFYVRRVKRILPAAVAVLVVTGLASKALFGATRFASVLRDEVSALLFAANFRFAAVGTDYFQQGRPPSPVQHFWSLAVEEQFYLVWPWLLLALLLVGTRRLHWDRTRALRGAAVVLGLFTAVSLAWAIHQTRTSPSTAYFATASRGWELGVGALLAVVARRRQPLALGLRTALAWAGLVGIVVSVFVVPETGGFPAPWAALPVLSTALVIFAGQHGHQPYLWPLTNPVSNWLGNLSYSLYIWHFPVIVLLVALLPAGHVSYYAAAISLIAVLTVASYYGIEDPARRSAWLTGARGPVRPGRRIMAGLLALTAALALISAVRHTTAAATPQATSPQATTPCLGAGALDPAHSCSPDRLGSLLVPSVDRSPVDTAEAFDCWSDPGKPMQTCSYGSTAPGAKTIALVGDSHAAMLIPGLMTELVANNWRLDTYVGWGCLWMTAADATGCQAAMAQIQTRLTTGTKYDIVLTSGARQKSAADKATVSRQMAAAWAPVAERGTKIVVLADNPAVSPATLACINRVGFDPSSSACATPRAQATSVLDPQIKAVRLVPGSKLVDLTAYFCRATSCPAVIGHEVVYRDSTAHLTATYSRSLAPYVAPYLTAALTSATR